MNFLLRGDAREKKVIYTTVLYLLAIFLYKVTCWQEVDTALVRKEQEIDDGGCPVFESVCPKERFLESSYTSSTAQGGGGSFKNRKPIGEVGCCESGMAERSH